ncbi:MAG: hypothetical protein ACR2RL_03735, partial [Gammaproteobacteria bacterium]
PTQATSSSNSMLAPAARGCAYAPRCPICAPACAQQRPVLDLDTSGHGVRCLRRAEVASGELSL